MRGASRRADPAQRLAREARPRRVDDDDVGRRPRARAAPRANARPRPRRTPRSDAVQLGVLDRARDRLLRRLDAPHRQRAPRHDEADRAGAAVEVVDRLAAVEARVLDARARRAAPPSPCSSAGRRSAARGSAGRRAPPRSRPRPRAVRTGRSSPRPAGRSRPSGSSAPPGSASRPRRTTPPAARPAR